jgi:D-sedoheptulose 7-phosphate isomerase
MNENDELTAFFERSLLALTKAAADTQQHQSILAIADCIDASLRKGGRIYLAGNGGSAADAQHIAAEFISRFMTDRQPLPAIALTTDSSVLTAIANDYGFEHVFARQLAGLGGPSDVFFAISTSGRSPNIISGLAQARSLGMATVGFSGASGGLMPPLCDHCLQVPSHETGVIQQLHIVAAHAICLIAERRLLAASAGKQPDLM